MNQVFYYHGKTVDGRRFTIAGVVNSEGKIIRRQIFCLGLALCSRSDQFVKSTGRIKAFGRVLSHGKRGKAKLIYPHDDSHLPKYFADSLSKYNERTSRDLQKDFNLYHDETKGKKEIELVLAELV